MAKKKFSPRQVAQLNGRKAMREIRRDFDERYVEENRHIVERDMLDEMSTWY